MCNIYISTGTFSEPTLETVERLALGGFRNIELSGGGSGKELDSFINTLLEMQQKYALNFICHNYFYSHPQKLVLNLASGNDHIYQESVKYYQKAIELCDILRSPKYALHAGLFIDSFPGKPHERVSSINQFVSEVRRIISVSSGSGGAGRSRARIPDCKFYVENNELPSEFHRAFEQAYGGGPSMMLTNFHEYLELRKILDFNLLLDVGHLHVSTTALDLDFEEELNNFWNLTDYMHISNNDGNTDQHLPLDPNSKIYSILKNFGGLKNRTVTLEYKTDLNDLLCHYENIKKLF
ncbi:MAG: TIM barrel protein [Oligoflexia bacterium]|nr:TIM barrel protein [Oligoflexia bacterium]